MNCEFIPLGSENRVACEEKYSFLKVFIFFLLFLGKISVFSFFDCVSSETDKGERNMTPTENDFYLEKTFDSFCKKVIKNESRNIHKRLRRTAEHEISLSGLSAADEAKLWVEDSYNTEKPIFTVDEKCFSVDDERLATALAFLTPQRREVILLSFFLGYSDAQIGRKLRISPDTISYRKSIAIEKLRELLGGFEDD